MSDIKGDIVTAFCERMAGEDTLTPYQIDELRSFLTTKKKPKAADVIAILKTPAKEADL